MSPSASFAVEFLGVQNGSDANGTVVNGSNKHLELFPGKHLAKLRCMASFANAFNFQAILF